MFVHLIPNNHMTVNHSLMNVNLACTGIFQLFMKPVTQSIAFHFMLKEPTSGLDSSTAYSIMKSIKQFAEMYNKTVIVSIHQPSSQVYRMFDSLLLLSDGKVLNFYCLVN